MKIKNTPIRTVLSLSALALLITGGLLYAGPLDPPAGPITPTYKTLTEVEPRTAINATNTPGDADSLFKITERGSYYLTGNIRGFAGKHGIEIVASGVTLDLNGFDLVGIPKMGLVDGVSVTVASLTNIAVVNGSVRDWGDEGVDLGTLSATNCRVEGVLASGNLGNGISTGDGCAISNFSANSNTGAGISTGDGCTVSNCSANSNTGGGINAGPGCTVTHCAAFQNGGIGINTSAGSTISNCSAYDNTGSGINASRNSTVVDCSARLNTLDGIVCQSECIIRGNTCASNGAGIHATFIDNRIEGNNCIANVRGIDVDAAGSIIIRNTCSGNGTNWVIAANNYYGPIIDRTGIATASVNGPAAAGTLATADPHANFSY